MKTAINLDALAVSDCADLHPVVARAAGSSHGVHEVDIGALPLSARDRFHLDNWVEHEELKNKSNARGTERLREYMAGGLVDNQAKREKIIEWLAANANSYG